MTSTAPEAFFLATPDGGQRYCLYQAAADISRGAVLYVPPFAEEMHKTRRMAALLARQLALQGIATLRIDLQGCGDSSGDFAEARWATWHDDLARASAWLEQRSGHRPALLGLRLGALLAMDYAAATSRAATPHRLILWQPVLDGAAYLTQFLRLRMVGGIINADATARNSNLTCALRARLAAGEALEVGGYELAPELAQAVDGLTLAPLGRASCALHWFDIGQPGRTLSPAATSVLVALRVHDAEVVMVQLDGPAF